MKKFGEK